MSFDGKIALITGGSRGIGKACARALGEAGATVIIASRNLEQGAKAAEELSQKGIKAEAIRIDVADHQEVSEAISKIISSFERIDILINNAAITRDGLLLRMRKEDWDAVIATNLHGVFNCTREVLPSMIRRRYGRIINITSVVAQAGNTGQANYIASKAGIIGFTKAVAREVASRNITVNAVAPGFIDTDMTRALAENVRQKLIEAIPLGRMGTDMEVAYGVRFLASDEASFITGHVLNINGGMYM